jgi:Amt family ammonium transporter
MTGGFAALVAAAVLGPRAGKYDGEGKPRALPGHSVPLAMTGVLILFIGWFGFNPGSQLQADMAVPLIAVLTAFAGAAGGLSGMATSWVTGGKPDVSMAGNGILAGLVAVCSGIGEFSWFGAVATGLLAGCLVVFAVLFIERRGIDDPVGAFAVHGVCGFWGLLATGLFATTTPVNGAATSAGLLYGGGISLLGKQLLGGLAIAATVTMVAAAIFVALRSLNLFRVSEEDEAIGLDLGEHGSPGYGPELLTVV